MLLKSSTKTKDNVNGKIFSDNEDTPRINKIPTISSKYLTNPYSQAFELSNKVSCSLFEKATKGINSDEKNILFVEKKLVCFTRK